MTRQIKRICAGCGEFLGGDPNAGPQDISHGSCKECSEECLKAWEEQRAPDYEKIKKLKQARGMIL